MKIKLKLATLTRNTTLSQSVRTDYNSFHIGTGTVLTNFGQKWHGTASLRRRFSCMYEVYIFYQVYVNVIFDGVPIVGSEPGPCVKRLCFVVYNTCFVYPLAAFKLPRRVFDSYRD